MNTIVKNSSLVKKVFAINEKDFQTIAIEVFQFQHAQNPVYRQYCDYLKIDPTQITTIQQIPFLPIGFFKSHIVAYQQQPSDLYFESSGTTGFVNSKHHIHDVSVYEKSFSKALEQFYGDVGKTCIIGLLPNYLERKHSSLVYMVDALVKNSSHPSSGFYLYDQAALANTLTQLEQQQQPTILIGVTFALLDFAENYPQPLQFTTIIETGGMKGRKKELTRPEVHQILKNAFQVKQIHAEYGMTELLSQAYAKADGLFNCPPWMKILLRSADDPFGLITDVTQTKTAAINIIDLANIYSCSFIATDDVGRLHPNQQFEVIGRLDHSDIRGCSLMAL